MTGSSAYRCSLCLTSFNSQVRCSRSLSCSWLTASINVCVLTRSWRSTSTSSAPGLHRHHTSNISRHTDTDTDRHHTSNISRHTDTDTDRHHTSNISRHTDTHTDRHHTSNISRHTDTHDGTSNISEHTDTDTTSLAIPLYTHSTSSTPNFHRHTDKQTQ